MLGKRRMLESVVKHGSRRARPLRVKLDCLNSNLDLVYVNAHRKNACNRCHLLLWPEPLAEAIPEDERRLTKSDQEMNGDPKVRLERISETYHGITYEGRPLR
jgi:hypothetical protein